MSDSASNPLVQVTEDEFFRLVLGGKLNVHPRSERDASYWEFPNRVLFGKTTPGYLREGPEAYFVAQHALRGEG